MAENAKNTGGRTSTLKALAILLAILALEGATIGVTMWLSGPKAASAEGEAAAEEAAGDELIELLVLQEKFPNLRSGRQMLYDVEIYITAEQRHNKEDKLKERLESRRAQIVMEIATIVRRAEPSFFNEPTLATLRRQVKAVLDERLGTSDDGDPVVQEVLITRCTPFRADF